jgi:hypothetical protein
MSNIKFMKFCQNHWSLLYSLAGRYDNHIPTEFLAPVDVQKFQHRPARLHRWAELIPLESIPRLLKRLQIRARLQRYLDLTSMAGSSALEKP